MNSFLIKTLANSLRQQTSSVLIKLEYSSGSGGGPGAEKDDESLGVSAATNSAMISNQMKKTAINEKDSRILGKIAAESKQLSERVAFLNSKSLKFDYGWNNLQMNLCKQAENEFFVNSETGDFHCLKCKKSGDWKEFESLATQFNENIDCNFSQVGLLSSHLISSTNPAKDIPNIELWQKSTPLKQVDNNHYKILIRNSSLDTDFSRSTLERHDIRIMDSKALYPVYDVDGELTEIAVIDSKDRDETNINLESIYGIESLRHDTKTLFITDKIKNMLAINEMIKKPAIVVNSLSSLTPKLLVHLEKFDTIIFLHRDIKLALSIAQAINHTRCYLTNYAKSPFESLQLKEDFWKIVEHEKFSLKNNTLIKFEELKESVYDRILNAKKYSGVKWKRFQILNEILKGHRAGELTIFTGPTGSGKTTFLSEYSLDLTMQGLRTLWGSFEIQNHRLAKLMMTQFAGMNLYKNITLFDSISQQFSRLPIYFMNFHGQESVENVLKTMSNAVVLYDINHIIIDNLQFMIGSQFPNAFDKYNQQDLIIGAFRRFATNFNCHITIVIHPKKEEGDDLLKISSVFGSAKSTQEADNVLILQVSKSVKEERGNFLKFIEVCKNRYDGELGKMVIRFDKEKLSFITKKIYREESSMHNKWKGIKHDLDEEKTMAILNNQSDLTNSNNLEIDDDDSIQLKNFPPSLIK